MQTASNIIDSNWKALIKPNKLQIVSNEDKSYASVIAEPLEKGFVQTLVLPKPLYHETNPLLL